MQEWEIIMIAMSIIITILYFLSVNTHQTQFWKHK